MQKTIPLPNIGDVESAEIIEIMVQAGDSVEQEAPLITLETDKAAMDIPCPEAGKVVELKVKVGDSVSEGDPILVLEAGEDGGGKDEKESGKKEEASKDRGEEKPKAGKEQEKASKASDSKAKSGESEKNRQKPDKKPSGGDEPAPSPAPPPDTQPYRPATSGRVHAGPAVRKLGRKLGVDLSQVSGSGPRGRILKEDVQAFVKQALTQKASGGGLDINPPPSVDFAEFGEIETVELTKIQRLTGQNTHSAWMRIPHVTQFDRADITEVEAFRQREKAQLAKRDIKLTLLPFLIKAAVSALKAHPRVNSSLDPEGEHLIQKRYFHISIAVDTPQGLMVPVVRDADKKSLSELAEEVADLAERARKRKLAGHEMKGGCFTLTSLGHIGGSGFTPIINEPEVAIMGISKATTEALYNGKDFEPKLILPLSLSYDHRVIDGVLAARFARHFAEVLEDSRRLLL
ncbi:MAG: 2-oxo acid dehydrogenase subunit E2 [Pseudomonadota bacterium]